MYKNLHYWVMVLFNSTFHREFSLYSRSIVHQNLTTIKRVTRTFNICCFHLQKFNTRALCFCINFFLLWSILVDNVKAGLSHARKIPACLTRSRILVHDLNCVLHKSNCAYQADKECEEEIRNYCRWATKSFLKILGVTRVMEAHLKCLENGL